MSITEKLFEQCTQAEYGERWVGFKVEDKNNIKQRWIKLIENIPVTPDMACGYLRKAVRTYCDLGLATDKPEEKLIDYQLYLYTIFEQCIQAEYGERWVGFKAKDKNKIEQRWTKLIGEIDILPDIMCGCDIVRKAVREHCKCESRKALKKLLWLVDMELEDE